MTEKLRWARAGAVLAVIAAVLVGLVVVTNRAGARRTAEPARTTVATAVPGEPVFGPAALGGTLTLTGGPGFVAELAAVRGTDPGVLSFTVHVSNLGTAAFDGALKSGVWLATDGGSLVGPKAVLPSASTVGPGSQADRVIVFPVPSQGRPAQLRITLHLGTFFSTGIWTVAS